MREKPPRGAHLPPGYDEEDPYADINLGELPEWWRKNVETFREYGMRPYRPPRFSDGKHTPPVISRLESELKVKITLRALDPEIGDRWEIQVDDEVIQTIGRYRDGNGYTVYETDSERFEEIVKVRGP